MSAQWHVYENEDLNSQISFFFRATDEGHIYAFKCHTPIDFEEDCSIPTRCDFEVFDFNLQDAVKSPNIVEFLSNWAMIPIETAVSAEL